MRFDAVIFDLDGTLADTLEDIADAMNRVLARQGLPVHDYAAYKQMIGRGLGSLVSDTLPAARRTPETIAANLEEMVGEYGRRCLVKTRLYEGVPELLGALRGEGLPLAVCSNKADELTQRIVRALTAPGTFEVVIGTRPGLPLKPDPAAALLAAERLGVPAGTTAYLGDSGVDMRTATSAGMIAVGVSWGFRTRNELLENGAAVVLAHPLDLLGLRG